MRPPRILDPRQVPVAGHDAHLPALPPERLSAHAIAARFAERLAVGSAAGAGGPREFTAEFGGDGRPFFTEDVRPAAVLVPLVERPEGLRVLLTRRTEHLRDHAGQISFPGGGREPADPGPEATALREAEEEVGLARHHVQVLGRLPEYHTVTGFHVTPVVAVVQPGFELALDSFEVAEAFEVPLAFLMTPAHHRRHLFTYEGGQRQFLSIPWHGVGSDGQMREYFIWGATAAMLRNLYRFIAD